MRFASLSSGSDGNCSYIGTEEAHILIDCGVGIRTIEAGLKSLSLSLKDIDAIFLTHEHIDHIKALGSILRKEEIPVYGSLGTLQGTLLCKSLKNLPKELLNPILTDRKFSVKDLDLLPFSIRHDSLNRTEFVFILGQTIAITSEKLTSKAHSLLNHSS